MRLLRLLRLGGNLLEGEKIGPIARLRRRARHWHARAPRAGESTSTGGRHVLVGSANGFSLVIIIEILKREGGRGAAALDSSYRVDS